MVRSRRRAYDVGQEDWLVEMYIIIERLRSIVVGSLTAGLSWKECFEHFDESRPPVYVVDCM